MVAIIDYGVGNLFSLRSSLAYLGEPAVVTNDPEIIAEADRVILPASEPLVTRRRSCGSAVWIRLSSPK